MQVFYSILHLFKQEKSFQWNLEILRTQIDPCGLIIITHELRVHAGRKAEYWEKERKKKHRDRRRT